MHRFILILLTFGIARAAAPVDLFNGKDLTGWELVANPATDIALTAPARASIKSIKVTGDKWEDYSMINSNIAAAEIGAVWINYDQTANGVTHGLAADLIKKLTIKDDNGTTSSTNWDWAGDSYSQDDWRLSLV